MIFCAAQWCSVRSSIHSFIHLLDRCLTLGSIIYKSWGVPCTMSRFASKHSNRVCWRGLNFGHDHSVSWHIKTWLAWDADFQQWCYWQANIYQLVKLWLSENVAALRLFVNTTSIWNNPVCSELMPDSSLLLLYQDQERATGNASMLLTWSNQHGCLCAVKLNSHLEIRRAFTAVET